MSATARGILFACVMLAVLGAPWEAARSEERAKTNLEVADWLTSQVVEELLSGMRARVGLNEITLSPYATDERHLFIADVFARILTSNGFKTFSPRSGKPGEVPASDTRENASGGIRLEFRAMNFNLRYPKIYRSHLIGGKMVKRRADVKLLAKVFDESDDAVLWVGEGSRSFEDQFSYDQIAEVESGLYEFAKPVRGTTKWGKLVEPVVVSGIIVGLIYLFFSNQSGE